MSAVSSITKEVCSEASSAPLNEIVTVWPANDERLNDFCAYPVFLFRFEYVARVVDPAFTVSLSYAVVVVEDVRPDDLNNLEVLKQLRQSSAMTLAFAPGEEKRQNLQTR